jgi:hypothetical protein
MNQSTIRSIQLPLFRVVDMPGRTSPPNARVSCRKERIGCTLHRFPAENGLGVLK